jgi:hypothetical protein
MPAGGSTRIAVRGEALPADLVAEGLDAEAISAARFAKPVSPGERAAR